MAEPVLERLKQLIRDKMPQYVGRTEVEDDTLLFEGGLELDSVAAVELIAATEEHFGIEYQEDDLTEELFASPRTLAALLEKRGAR